MFKIYLRLLSFASPFWRYAVPYFFYAAFHAIFNTFNYVMIIPILNAMFKEGFHFTPVFTTPQFEVSEEYFSNFINYAYTQIFGTEFRMTYILSLLAGVLIITNMLGNLFRYLSSYTVEQMRTKAVQRMRNEMFDNVITMDVGYFTEQRKGNIISHITQDVMTVQFCITNTLQVIFREPFLIAGYLFAMLKISWELAAFSVLFLPFVGLIIGSIVKRLRHPAGRAQGKMADLVSVLDESISGVKVLKTYNATGYIKDKFHGINKVLSDLMLWMARRQQLASPMSEFLGVSAVAIILVFGGSLVMKGSISAAGFIAFIAMFSQITRPVRMIIDQFANINQGVAAGERIFEMIDAKKNIVDKENALEFNGLKEGISVCNLSFSYDESREILHNISFDIKKGETVAIIGQSGGGKSTLSEVIARFYDPQKGEVMIDGIPSSDYTVSSLHRNISLVSQETILFNDSIENNIAIGKIGASHEEIIQAAEIANADKFIDELPEGYDTNIGERGSKLSGGQRQRISIARAILKNPDILILDEATSALDTESERLVQEALNHLLKNRTSIVIAHRLSTIRHADKIVVIDEGAIKEQGTHEELMKLGGIYTKLIEMQNIQ